MYTYLIRPVYFYLVSIALALSIVACATVPGVEAQVANGKIGLASAYDTVAELATAKQITKAEGEGYLQRLAVVKTGLDAAEGFARKGDTSTAGTQLQAASAALRLVRDELAKAKKISSPLK